MSRRWRGALPRAGYWQASGLHSLNDSKRIVLLLRARGPQIVDTGHSLTRYDPAPSKATA